VVKEHHEDNVWVSDVKLEEGLLELERVQWENGAYVAISSDHIMNNLTDPGRTGNAASDHDGAESHTDRSGLSKRA
jgi:hypothetical protein